MHVQNPVVLSQTPFAEQLLGQLKPLCTAANGPCWWLIRVIVPGVGSMALRLALTTHSTPEDVHCAVDKARPWQLRMSSIAIDHAMLSSSICESVPVSNRANVNSGVVNVPNCSGAVNALKLSNIITTVPLCSSGSLHSHTPSTH